MNFSVRFSTSWRTRPAIVRAIVFGMLLVSLPSCGIPPLRNPQGGPVLPPDFNGATTADNSSQLGIEEFYNDRMLTSLIEKALLDNRELKILNEEVQIAANEVLARSGAYLPFVTVETGAGLNRTSRFTVDGAGLLADQYLPGKYFPNPHGNFGGGALLTWQLDIYRQLRNARDAASLRYVAASEKRNYYVTTLIAEIAENFYKLMALDKRLENLNQIIELQTKSLDVARARREAARATQLSVLRFEAEVQRNKSEKLIINQSIIESENKINFLVNRYPQRVERISDGFYDLTIHPLSVGVPSQLLQNRPDIRQAERELAATGLDVEVARVNFYPQLVISGGVALQSFIIDHLFEPQAVIGDITSGLVGPLINKRAIRAQYLTANARQLQAIYNYQRVILEAFTQVINRVTMVENYTKSIEIRKQQLKTLEAAVRFADDLFQYARIEYIDVLFSQRDLRDARVVLIDTKLEQLSAIVKAYQALGGGITAISTPQDFRGQFPYLHTVRAGENFWTVSLLYYRSGRYCKALWAANQQVVSSMDRLKPGDKILIPRPDQLNPALFEEIAVVGQPVSATMSPPNGAVVSPVPAPPAQETTSPFGAKANDLPADKAGASAPASGTATPPAALPLSGNAALPNAAPGSGAVQPPTALPLSGNAPAVNLLPNSGHYPETTTVALSVENPAPTIPPAAVTVPPSHVVPLTVANPAPASVPPTVTTPPVMSPFPATSGN